jgi:outer membrane protein assembly factor BamB
MSRLAVAGCLVVLFAAFSFARAEEPTKSPDWPQWGGTSLRNNAPEGRNIASDWDVGGFERKTDRWLAEKARNIKWVAKLGSQTYGSPVVADGRVYVGTNNNSRLSRVKRYPYLIDLGCCLCFSEADGDFLWQFSAEKLPTGLANDWPFQGIFGSPLVEGDRMWLVSNRCEVVCLDTQGFYDNEDDGPVREEWIKQFSVEPLVQSGLNDGSVSRSLAALFEKAGAKIERGTEVEVVEQDKKWTIAGKGFLENRILQVRVERTNIIASEIIKKGRATEVRDLFSVDARLTLGLDDGRLPETLRTHFAQSGIELPATAAPKASEPGKRWTLHASVAGVETDFRMFLVGNKLTCERLLTPNDKHEADVVWRFDMIKELGVFPHNFSPCSPTAWGDTLFICTSNAVNESHLTIPRPDAPSFLALDKRTGKVLWTDNSPGDQILHTQWSSPAVGRLGMVPQVIFGGGDGWLYSFRADRWNEKEKKPELLWKFDGNPKESKFMYGGRGTRNEIVAIPVIHDELVYLPMGQDPEHGEGQADLWCIDPTKRGDVSPTLAVRSDDRRTPIPRRRIQAVDRKAGETVVPNPNSAVVWHYSGIDENGDGVFQPTEKFHRSRGTAVIKNGLLVIADFGGIVHCLDAKTGKVHWTHDQLASSWGSPLIVDNKVYVADEDGDVAIFGLSARRGEALRKNPFGGAEFVPLADINMDSSVYTTPIVANNVLYIANKTHLFAIEAPK